MIMAFDGVTIAGIVKELNDSLLGGRIYKIAQPESDELMLTIKVIEIMGKHSNIIFIDDKDMIIDSIKHISGMVSSVREVLPGRPYFIPETQKKKNALDTNREEFLQTILSGSQPVYKTLYASYTGFSPVFAQELCFRAGLDGDASTAEYCL